MEPVTTRGSFQVVDHPLIRHKLAYIRNRATKKKEFKEFVDEVTTLMAFEITRDFPLEPIRVETPLAETDGHVLGDLQVVLSQPVLARGVWFDEGKQGPIHLSADCNDGGDVQMDGNRMNLVETP